MKNRLESVEDDAKFTTLELERNEHGIWSGNDRETVSHNTGDAVVAQFQHVVKPPCSDANDVQR